MSDSRPADPGEAFRKIVTEWERNFDAFANRVMGTTGYSRAMNTAQSSQLRMQQAFADLMGRQLAAMNIPTRDDILRLSETVSRLERRLARIEDGMARDTPTRAVDSGPPPASAVRRSRQPPADYREATSEARREAAPSAPSKKGAGRKSSKGKSAPRKAPTGRHE